jgi:hypothetical protein
MLVWEGMVNDLGRAHSRVRLVLALGLLAVQVAHEHEPE